MSNEFLDLIQTQRGISGTTDFSGTLLDYLKVVKETPEVAVLAHRRLYDAIKKYGITPVDESDTRCVRLFEGQRYSKYDYFTKDFFGMDRTIAKIMRYLHSASLRGEESRQILLLMGPVGAGKSALLEHIKRALELSAPVYHIKDCPIREEPLHLIPRSLRPAFEEKLGVKIEGDLCPICRWRLKNEYDGKYEAMPVAMTGFSTRARKGVGVVPPVDANTQDTSLLIGTEDISKLDKYSEDDPRVLSLNGAFNVGNRGMVELVEVFKNEIEFLHTVITATQEKSIPAPGKHSMIYFDGVIIAHCNEAEWNRFKSTHTNEAILDRIVPIYVPYSLELNEEVKIYTKQLGRSDFKAHVAPHTIELASMFSVMSRLKQTEKCDPLIKMKIYNGDEVTEKGRAKKIDIKDLREEARHEGMTGISTRFIMKAIDNALSDSDRNMITPISVRDSLIKQVKESTLPDEERTRYLALLQKTVYDEYLKILEKEIAKAFVSSFSEQAETLFQNYIDNVEAYVNRTMVKDAVTREEINPDETFMRSIEEQIGITGTARDGFRSDITSYMMRALRRKEKLTYDCYAPLKEAIEAKLIFSVREMSRIVTKAKSRDDKQQRKYGDVVKTLIDTYGYNEDSAEEILKFAANHLWRDS
jgi:serine protein kinase